jgi:hypothetical protein
VIEATCAREQLPHITEDPEDCAAKHAAIESTVGSVDGIKVMGKHETGFARVARDHYPTREVWVTEALLDHVDVAGLKIWEMAAGAGDMAEVLKAAGAWVFCSDIADYGYPSTQCLTSRRLTCLRCWTSTQ